MKYDYDIIVIGAGPAGSTTALYAARVGLKVLLLDKKCFPRDKICGDAISRESLSYIHDLGLSTQMEKALHVPIYTAFCFAPNGKSLKIDLNLNNNGQKKAFMYICRRMIFDNILIQAAQEKTDVIENCTVKDLLIQNGQVYGVKGQLNDSKEVKFTGKVIVGADGFNSIVLRKLGIYKHESDHWASATRAYYSGINDLKNSIEIYLLKDSLPGYFWVFPTGDGIVNAGLIILHKKIKKNNIRLRDMHQSIIESSIVRKHFKNAKPMGDIRGWNLPMASKQRQVYGNGFILVGDAAGLVDPLTGEGIGNAMRSGKVAADFLAEVCKGIDYSATHLKKYPVKLFEKLNNNELKLHYRLQRLSRFSSLINFIVNRAAKQPEFTEWFSKMAKGIGVDANYKKELTSLFTYLKLLFKV